MANHFILNRLREICTALYLLVYPESSYYARHTYATIAANKCGISESDVGLLLNHVGTGTDRHEARSIKVTRGYIGRDWSKIDRWHRQVLDFVKNPDKK